MSVTYHKLHILTSLYNKKYIYCLYEPRWLHTYLGHVHPPTIVHTKRVTTCSR